jgi:hypothetical protein
MSGTDHPGVTGLAALETFRTWRTIQLLSLLPLALCVVFMLISSEASSSSAFLLFILIVAGIVIPEMKSDMALNRFIVTREQTGISQELRQLLKGDLRHLRKDPVIQDLLQEHLVSPRKRNWT